MYASPHSLRDTLRPAGSPVRVRNTSFSNRCRPMRPRQRGRHPRRALQPVDVILAHARWFYRRLVNIVPQSKETLT